jgi:hypothetical protein
MRILSFNHESKAFSRQRLNLEEYGGETAYKDPRDAVKKMISMEHKKLGTKRIAGVLAEGIQVNDPALVSRTTVKEGEKPVKQTVDRVDAKLWVDAASQLPVLFEIESESQGVRVRQIIDQFQWDIPNDEAFFWPEIPEGYVERDR